MASDLLPIRFIDVEIEVLFDRPPVLSKKPTAPNGFVWNGETFRVQQVLSSWVDYSRHGRMAKNMEPAHSKVAARHGSWGVGRFYFRVRSNGGRLFDLYYDRAPEDAGDRKGHWVLFREMAPR